MTVEDDALEVAFVCTGNRFRSPLAAALLAAEAPGVRLRVSSTGLLDLGPVAALPEAVELAATLDVDLGGHRARALHQLDLSAFDLVLGFERAHVRAAVVDGSARIERTFTLPELVDLLETVGDRASLPDPVAQARARIGEASEARPPDFRTRAVAEIADPLGRRKSEQRRTAEELDALIGRLSKLLFD